MPLKKKDSVDAALDVVRDFVDVSVTLGCETVA